MMKFFDKLKKQLPLCGQLLFGFYAYESEASTESLPF